MIEAAILGMILACMIGFATGWFICKVSIRNQQAKTPEDKLPPCNCPDVNQCITWCYAKEMMGKYDR